MPNFATPAFPEQTPAPNPGVLVSDIFSQNFGYVVRRARGTRDWLILFTLAGLGRYQQGERVVFCQAGDITLLPPGRAHHYETASRDKPWRFIWAHFIPRPTWIPWLELPGLSDGLGFYSVRQAEARGRIEAALGRMVVEGQRKDNFQEDLAQNALEEALLLVRREIASLKLTYSDERVDAVQKYLEQHYNQPLSLPDLAKMVWLSPWHLSHLFKEKTGQTVSECLVQLRMRQAARLLSFTSRTVEEIARDVGFESPFYFSRLFKRYYGISPLPYRKREQSGGTKHP